MLKIEQIFAPNLRSGAIVVMDILLCYKVADTWEVIEYQQIPLLYLPLYNPDPIRNAFAQASSSSTLTSAGTCSGTRAGQHVGHGFKTSAASR